MLHKSETDLHKDRVEEAIGYIEVASLIKIMRCDYLSNKQYEANIFVLIFIIFCTNHAIYCFNS